MYHRGSINRRSYVSSRAELGMRVRLGQGVQIFGHVIIGDDTIVDADVTLGYPVAASVKARLHGQDLVRSEDFLDQATTKTTFIGRESLIRRFSVFYEGVTVGKRLDCAHDVVVREGCVLEDNVELGTMAYLKSDVHIGESSTISAQVCDRTHVGRHCTIHGNIVHKFPAGISGLKEESPSIEDGVVIGRGALVIGKVSIKRLALVGAGSVVTRSVAEKTVVVGNPARFLRNREEAECQELWERVEGLDARRL
jgi:acetyltransferase-like isoleucine patch superfamily enzyme